MLFDTISGGNRERFYADGPPTLPLVARSLPQGQVGETTEQYLQYDWGGRAIEHHRAQIRAARGFREATVEDGAALVAWLVETILPYEHCRERLPDALRHRCRVLHLAPPRPGRIDRLVRSAVHTDETQLFAATLAQLTPAQVAAVDGLVAGPLHADEPPPDDTVVVTFQDLRADPGRVGLDSLLNEIAKLRRIRQLDLPPPLFQQVAPESRPSVSRACGRGDPECLAGAPRADSDHAPNCALLGTWARNH